MIATQLAAEVESLVSSGLRQSRWLRARPADSRWLIAAGVEYLSHAACDGNQEERMRSHLAGLVRSRYGNPLLVWFLINVVLPIVVKLVIEWWFRRGEV
ncbi:MAG: hypothetical protein NUV77_02570 [Thermoguttaceae bacterium]|jgi:hypothetical protein|nr:hypothetical protein [Thermoguttaceae bacterium]